MDIEKRLRDLSDKWKFANHEVADACRDAAEEIRVLRVTLKNLQSKDSIIHSYNYGSGWGKGKDE